MFSRLWTWVSTWVNRVLFGKPTSKTDVARETVNTIYKDRKSQGKLKDPKPNLEFSDRVRLKRAEFTPEEVKAWAASWKDDNAKALSEQTYNTVPVVPSLHALLAPPPIPTQGVLDAIAAVEDALSRPNMSRVFDLLLEWGQAVLGAFESGQLVARSARGNSEFTAQPPQTPEGAMKLWRMMLIIRAIQRHPKAPESSWALVNLDVTAAGPTLNGYLSSWYEEFMRYSMPNVTQVRGLYSVVNADDYARNSAETDATVSAWFNGVVAMLHQAGAGAGASTPPVSPQYDPLRSQSA